MGKFIRERLPEPQSYYTDIAGLTLIGKGPWRTTRCDNHGGSDSMRINTASGAFVCMAGCGARGGDVLAYHRAAHCLGFIDAAKALGAWVDDGKPYVGPTRPSQPSARALLQLTSEDLYPCAGVVSCVLVALDEHPALRALLGDRLSDADIDGFMQAAGRVIHIAEVARNV